MSNRAAVGRTSIRLICGPHDGMVRDDPSGDELELLSVTRNLGEGPRQILTPGEASGFGMYGAIGATAHTSREFIRVDAITSYRRMQTNRSLFYWVPPLSWTYRG